MEIDTVPPTVTVVTGLRTFTSTVFPAPILTSVVGLVMNTSTVEPIPVTETSVTGLVT